MNDKNLSTDEIKMLNIINNYTKDAFIKFEVRKGYLVVVFSMYKFSNKNREKIFIPNSANEISYKYNTSFNDIIRSKLLITVPSSCLKSLIDSLDIVSIQNLIDDFIKGDFSIVKLTKTA